MAASTLSCFCSTSVSWSRLSLVSATVSSSTPNSYWSFFGTTARAVLVYASFTASTTALRFLRKDFPLKYFVISGMSSSTACSPGRKKEVLSAAGGGGGQEGEKPLRMPHIHGI
jgi:hypothetical protein